MTSTPPSRPRISEIEDAIAAGKMDAPMVFTKMRELVSAAERRAEARAREACTFEGRTGCSFRPGKLDAGFDEWVARELPRATGFEIDLCRTVWIGALASLTPSEITPTTSERAAGSAARPQSGEERTVSPSSTFTKEDAANLIERKARSLTDEYCRGDTGPGGYVWTNKEAEWQVILLEELAEEIRNA